METALEDQLRPAERGVVRARVKREEIDSRGAENSQWSYRTVYVAVYTLTVRRTNIYLSAVEQAALDAKAATEGSTRSEVLRALVDRQLNLDDEGSEEVDAALVGLASELAERSRQLSATDADLSSST